MAAAIRSILPPAACLGLAGELPKSRLASLLLELPRARLVD